MYAFGPKGHQLASNNLAVGLSQHDSYGKSQKEELWARANQW
jgi:hypothetical protein